MTISLDQLIEAVEKSKGDCARTACDACSSPTGTAVCRWPLIDANTFIENLKALKGE